MARKSKAAFKMKGHSIPGISGFKSTSLEDGRAASSAFQMKESPLRETKLGEDTDVDFTKDELGEEESKYDWSPQGTQGGVEYGMTEATKLAMRLRAEKEAREGEEGEGTDPTTEQKEKYDPSTDPHAQDQDDYQQSLLDKEKASVEKESFENLENQIAPVEYSEIEEKTTKPYEVQSGDNLSRIAKANNMTLEELLEKNPEYKDNPNFVRRGATLNL